MRIPLGLRAAAGNQGEDTDPYFNQTVMLLHGDGTNGAQNNTFIDSSSTNLTLTRTGNSTQGTFSPFSLPAGQWSNFFDGSGDSLSISPNTNLSFTNTETYTGEAFIYLQSFTGDPCIFANWLNGTSVRTRLVVTTTGSLQYTETSSGATVTYTLESATGIITLNTWYHVAVVRIGGGTSKLYLNGTEVAAQGSGTYQSIPNTTTFYIGQATTLSGFFRYFNGYISNFRLVKGTAVYTADFTPPTAPLTAITNTSLLTCQNNRFMDGSSNNFAITRNGDVRVTAFSPFDPSAAYDPATNGASGYFDGSGDYLTASASAALAVGTGDFTMECWVYPLAVNTERSIFKCYANNPQNYDLRITDGVFGFVYYETGITATTSIVTNAWVHLAATRQSGLIRVFVNGVLENSATNANNVSSSLPLKIAANQLNTGNFSGYISNIRIVKGTSLYNSSFTPSTTPLTAVSGTVLLTNFTNAGIIDNTGKNVLETVSNAQIDTAVKKYGTGSIEFNSAPDFCFAPSSVNFGFGDGNFTVEMWVYFRNTGNGQLIFGDYANTTNYGIAFFTAANGTLNYYLSSTGSSWNIASGVLIGNISTSTWYHVALVRNGSTFTPYFNGVAGTTTTNSSALINAAPPFCVGGNLGGNSMDGFIDDLRITKGVARYTSNFTPPTQAFPNL